MCICLYLNGLSPKLIFKQLTWVLNMNVLKMAETRKKLTKKLNRYRALKKQRGMTLLEIIIVLGIIGVIAAGVVILAQRAFDTKAMSDLANNANSVRVAVKDAYGPSGQYPAEVATATANLKNSAELLADTTTPIGKLTALGKLSPDEAINGISGNYIDIGAGQIGTKTNAGYYIVLNGLNQQQCRGILNQVGNQWDYVAIGTANEAAGTYVTHGNVALDAAANAYTPAVIDTTTGAVTTPATIAATGIYRSLHTGATAADSGANILTPDAVVGACNVGAANAVILGSR